MNQICEICSIMETKQRCWCGVFVCSEDCMQVHVVEKTLRKNGGPGFDITEAAVEALRLVHHNHSRLTIPQEYWLGNSENNPNYGAVSGVCCQCKKSTTTKQCKICKQWLHRPTENRDCMQDHLASHGLKF